MRKVLDTIKVFLADQAGIASEDMDFINDLTVQDWQTLLTRLPETLLVSAPPVRILPSLA
jgi:hypothetical protein